MRIDAEPKNVGERLLNTPPRMGQEYDGVNRVLGRYALLLVALSTLACRLSREDEKAFCFSMFIVFLLGIPAIMDIHKKMTAEPKVQEEQKREKMLLGKRSIIFTGPPQKPDRGQIARRLVEAYIDLGGNPRVIKDLATDFLANSNDHAAGKDDP